MPICRTKPRPWQRQAVDFGHRKKTWGCFAEMGLGKTLIALLWAIESGFKRIAVLGRTDDLDTWEEQITQHTNLTFVNVCRQKRKRKRIESLRLPAHIYLLTYDSVKQLRAALASKRWDAVIADESTEIKHRTKRTRAVLAVFGSIPCRLALTGTPITNTPMDAFFQMQFIDRGAALGTSWWQFRQRFFWPAPDGHSWFPFTDTIPRLRKKIYERCIRFRKADWLQLPPKVYVTKICELTREQRRHYQMVRDEFEMELKSGERLELDYIVQQFVKLLQITGGFLYQEDGPLDLPCGKLQRLERILDLPEFRRRKKTVLWATFNHEIKRIADLACSLGYKCCLFWKHTPDRKQARKQFAEDPKTKLFIGMDRRGIGMNELIGADTAIYYSRSLRLITRMQSEDRIHRLGSEKHRRIRYIDLIVPGTVDNRVFGLLRKARDVAARIVDGHSALSLLRT